MKTLLFHVNSFLAGGIEKVLIELLQALDPKKYRIKLSIGYDFGAHEMLKSELPAHIEVHYLLSNPILIHTQKKKKTAKIGFAEKLLGEAIFPLIRKAVQKKALRKLVAGVDVVIDFDTTLSRFYKVFAHKKAAAYCHFSFGQIWNGNKRKGAGLARRLSNYDKVVMLCDEMKAETAALYPALAPKLVRIYNALDKAKVSNLAEEPVDNSLTGGTGYIVSVGRLHEAQKDFTTLVKAYIQCVQQHAIQEHLVIVGYGEALDALKRLVDDAGLTNRVLFTGFQQNPYKWIRGASVFLFSSKYEGLPTVIIEAMLLGKPVIATACPTGVRELLMNGEAGILTEVGNVDAMANALQRMINEPPLQKQFVANAQSILGNFDAQFMVREFERLIIS